MPASPLQAFRAKGLVYDRGAVHLITAIGCFIFFFCRACNLKL